MLVLSEIALSGLLQYDLAMIDLTMNCTGLHLSLSNCAYKTNSCHQLTQPVENIKYKAP